MILVIVHLIHSLGTKRKVSLFYCWLGALAVWGGALAFLLPIALNSGFGKDHDGSALRQALLYATGGVLAVITLGETHRKNSQEKEKNENDHIRQVHAERRSRYTTAVEQLANEKAPVRLGGIYTLTGLVDEWLADDSLTKDKQKEEGQVIINNLCSYIRSPFPLAEKIDEYEARKELKELESKKLNTLLPDESPKLNALRKRFEDSAEYQEPDNIAALQAVFHEEQDVRRAIFEEMSKRSSRVSVDKSMEVTVTPGAWSCFKFDFSRAPIFYPLNNLTIEQGQFTSARFYGEADFQGAKFTKDANFRNAKFTGNADFRNTEFTGIANFRNTEFTGTTSFGGAEFTRIADFRNTEFTGNTYFGDAYFRNAKFTENADFRNAKFTEEAYFGGTEFTGNADFRNTEFIGNADFGDEYLRGAKFTKKADFRNAKFTENAHFGHAEFTENADFLGTEFSRNTSFDCAYFEKSAPIFADDSGAARFSAQKDQQDYVFSVSRGSKPINCGTATLDGKRFKIPLGAVLFDPDSWDEETKTYTRVSKPAKPLENSDTEEEKPTE
ncbi:pentapeptide repeat-containing protein [Rothia mucilaginosa]|uniref:pentapeptide repeat-containing protein n=1 Tax=Rothia mucilaginosa TaxID=43675 RepID=UPI001389A5CB|nr:pentapeptide repeat-containing protein [Rothia mucilaginosa]